MMDNTYRSMGVPIEEDASPREIGSKMYDYMKKLDWLTSYSYKRKEPRQYVSQAFPEDLRTYFNFAKYVYYVHMLFKNKGEEFELSKKEHQIYNEQKGMSCAYCSALLYLLLKKEDMEAGFKWVFMLSSQSMTL
ncbi:hypothetical protein ACIQYG_14110 [Peribacillus sp. NPDC096622]|uniref:hypothetical protein n=1 Tax=Peribacillus sp. NPDC096622 TaxID=3364396 RepID=UPI003825A6DB